VFIFWRFMTFASNSSVIYLPLALVVYTFLHILFVIVVEYRVASETGSRHLNSVTNLQDFWQILAPFSFGQV